MHCTKSSLPLFNPASKQTQLTFSPYAISAPLLLHDSAINTSHTARDTRSSQLRLAPSVAAHKVT